ncbi:SMP-30/gluconolactonase/LRE family protein [Kribbella speibonae]|uniref:SMP-30/gluconolactonase/LRE family protein n=1 Tax=Kribbella speibonae TaxID=1572660 RepID=UPI00192DAF2E|nr:SMP-30/gluconolactonase/LRE family protein [Kribbella speibonae]
MTTLVTASEETCWLGEGPLWDPVRSQLLWVDIRNGKVFRGRLRTDDTIETLETVQLGETVGAVGVSRSGEWILAGQKRMHFRSTAGGITSGPIILPESASSRLNDGKADPAGRYLIGTLSLAGPSETESLVAIEADASVRTLDADLTLSNGLAWSPDGHTMYNVDTIRQLVFARPYDPATGETGERKAFLTFAEGYPDGMTVDASGHLWIAMWGLGEVRRYSPDGHLALSINVPAPHTSSVAFAGAELDVLVITTATQDLSQEQLAAHPLSGRIFTIRTGVHGFPQPLWSGLPLSIDQSQRNR